MTWLAEFWCNLAHHWGDEPFPSKCEHCTAPRMVEARKTVATAVRPFTWIKDYGPYWEPGSTAFWLEPKTEGQLLQWVREYRPDFTGKLEAAGFTVNIKYPLGGTLKARVNAACYRKVNSLADAQHNARTNAGLLAAQNQLAAYQQRALYDLHVQSLSSQEDYKRRQSQLSAFSAAGLLGGIGSTFFNP